jgi:hypothetical protein
MYAVLIEVDVAGVDREGGIQALREQIVARDQAASRLSVGCLVDR